MPCPVAYYIVIVQCITCLLVPTEGDEHKKSTITIFLWVASHFSGIYRLLSKNLIFQYSFVPILVGRAKRAPHWGVQSRFRVIYVCMSVCLVCQINCVGGITWTKHAHAQSLSFFGG